MKYLLPANTVALTAPPYFILFYAEPDLLARLAHQTPQGRIVLPQVGITLVVRRANVQSHIEGRQNVSGVEIAAVVEFDALAQSTNPDRQVFIGFAGFGQMRFDSRIIDREA